MEIEFFYFIELIKIELHIIFVSHLVKFLTKISIERGYSFYLRSNLELYLLAFLT